MSAIRAVLVGNICLKADIVLHEVYSLLHELGLGTRRFLNGEYPDDFVVQAVDETLTGCPLEVYVELLVRLRRIQSEISVCSVLVNEVKSLPRNTTKEPL
jgi:hypothetical protein